MGGGREVEGRRRGRYVHESWGLSMRRVHFVTAYYPGTLTLPKKLPGLGGAFVFVVTRFVKIGGNLRRIQRGMRGGWGEGFFVVEVGAQAGGNMLVWFMKTNLPNKEDILDDVEDVVRFFLNTGCSMQGPMSSSVRSRKIVLDINRWSVDVRPNALNITTFTDLWKWIHDRPEHHHHPSSALVQRKRIFFSTSTRFHMFPLSPAPQQQLTPPFIASDQLTNSVLFPSDQFLSLHLPSSPTSRPRNSRKSSTTAANPGTAPCRRRESSSSGSMI